MGADTDLPRLSYSGVRMIRRHQIMLDSDLAELGNA
jgi:hypothetical protein